MSSCLDEGGRAAWLKEHQSDCVDADSKASEYKAKIKKLKKKIKRYKKFLK